MRLGALAMRALAMVLLAAAPAFAQSTGSTLQGTITDEQGAVMPGATVVMTNVETGWTRDVVTDERGWYRATALSPGNYEVKATLQGFATSIRAGPDDHHRPGGERQPRVESRDTPGGRDGHRRCAARRDDEEHARHDGDARQSRQHAAHHAQLRRPGDARAGRDRRRRRRHRPPRARPIAATATWWTASATIRS